MDPMHRRRTDRSESSRSSNSTKSSTSSIFRTRKVSSFQMQALEEERAARPQLYQWKCPRYSLTWEILEKYLRTRFPNETFDEFQSGDYWIFNAPEKQTQNDQAQLAMLRVRPEPQPHQHRRRSKSPE